MSSVGEKPLPQNDSFRELIFHISVLSTGLYESSKSCNTKGSNKLSILGMASSSQ